jgi:hypothetical protein
VDLDDCLQAPAIQDLWMFLSGERHDQELQLAELIEGYERVRDFPARQLRWIEALRTLRIIRYAAWLARRWDDPAFPRAFPWFASPRFWSDHILELREQFARLQEPPLRLLCHPRGADDGQAAAGCARPLLRQRDREDGYTTLHSQRQKLLSASTSRSTMSKKRRWPSGSAK